MKARHIGILVAALIAVASPAQDTKSTLKEPVPKYQVIEELTFKGVVDGMTDRECRVSGGMGSHVTLKLNDGQLIEVHLAKTKFVKLYELSFTKGEPLEVKGVKVKFEGADTIFAREVKRGNDLYMFRDKDGKPIW